MADNSINDENKVSTYDKLVNRLMKDNNYSKVDGRTIINIGKTGVLFTGRKYTCRPDYSQVVLTSVQGTKFQDDDQKKYSYILFSLSKPAENYILCVYCNSYQKFLTDIKSTKKNNSITISLNTLKDGIGKKHNIINAADAVFILAENGDPTNLINYIESDGNPIAENQNGDSKMEDKTTKDMIADEIENKNTKQLVLTGAPGTGKTFSAKQYVEEYISRQKDYWKDGCKPEKDYGFVQFHSSYSYTDFVEGLRPVMLGDKVSFVRMDGVFKEFCRKVVENGDTNHKYFFIIDEINRADLSKVFGELMFGLEDSYRGKENNFDTQYNNLPTYSYEKKDGNTKKVSDKEKGDVFADGFYIPENVIIIGTMNDIDRSVEAFDFALRRRFRWINVKANEIMEGSLEGILLKSGEAETENERIKEIKELAKAAAELNKTISKAGESFGLNDDYHIGPAYYKHFTSKTDKVEYFNSYLEPILREYVRGRKPEIINDFIGKCKSAFTGTKTKDGSEAAGKVNENE